MRLRFPTRCLLAAATLGCASTAQSQVLSEWLSPVDGNWEDPANWSTPAFPNNAGGATYDALIAPGGSGSYLVNLINQTVVLDSLTVNHAGARLFIANSEITAGTIDVVAGRLSTFNTTIHGSVITSSASEGPIEWALGSQTTSLDIERLAHSIDFNTAGLVDVISDLQLDDGIVVSLDGGFTLANGASLSTPGHATIELRNLPFRASHTSPVVAEIGSGIDIEFVGGGRRIIGWMDSYGVIRAEGDQNRGIILGRSSAQPFTNYGVIEALHGGRIMIGDQRNSRGFVNAGILLADADSRIVFDGDVEFASGSQLTGGGDFELLYGRLDLNGQAIDLDQIGMFRLREGTFANGTVTGSAGTALIADDDEVVFEAMTLGVDLQLNDLTHDIRGGLTLLNGADIGLLESGSSGRMNLRFTESQVIDGDGRFLFLGNNNVNRLLMTQSAGAVVFESGISIEAVGGDLQIGSDDKDWISRGTILAGTGNTVTLQGNWTNQGLMSIENDASLVLQGEYASSSLGEIDNQGGTLVVGGTLDNIGQTIDFTGAPGSVVRLGSEATVLGGTLQSSEGVQLEILQRAYLDGVTIDMEVPIANRVAASDSLTINNDFTIVAGANDSNGRLSIADAAGDGVTHLDGTGTIMFTPHATSSSARDVQIGSTAGTTLDIGSDLTILMDQPTLRLYLGEDARFDLHGTLDLRVGSTVLDTVWTSDGAIRVAAPATLFAAGHYSTADLMTIDYQGGTIKLGGTLDNTGALLRVDESTAWLGHPPSDTTSGFTLVGGRVETAEGEALTSVRHLNGVTLAGDLWLLPEAGSTISNGLVFDHGTLHVSATQLFLQSGEISGNGTITFEVGNVHIPMPPFLSLPSGSTLPVGLSVNTGGGSGEVGTGTFGSSWTNDGTLQSLNDGLELFVTGDVLHTGHAHAANGGTLSFENLTNQGTLLAEDFGTIRLQAGWTNPTGTITATSGGQITLESWSSTPGAFVLNSGVLRVEFDTDLAMLTALPQSGGSVIELADELDLMGGTLDLDTFDSTFRMSGGTLRDGSVVGTSPLRLVKTTATGVNTLDAVEVLTDVSFANGGTTELRGGSAFRGSTISGDGTLYVGATQTATLDAVTLESMAVVDPDATLAVSNGLTLNGVVASGGGSGTRPQVRFDGTQAVGGAGTFRSATSSGLNLRFSGDLTTGSEVNLEVLQGVLSLNGAGHTLTLGGRLDVAVARTAVINADTLINHGTLQLNPSGQIHVNANTLTNHGTIDLNGGQLSAANLDIDNTIGSRIITRGAVDLGGDGTLRIAGEVQNPQLLGSRLLVIGHVELQDTAQTTMTLFNGRNESTAFLHATGDVSIGGDLLLDAESLTQLEAGQMQTLVLAEGTLSGVFFSVNSQQIDPTYYWHLNYTNDRLVAEVRLGGDANGDGLVGVEDLDLILANWGGTVTAGDASAGDWTGDGTVGSSDLQVVLDHWGFTVDPQGGNVPEPGSLAALAMLGLALAHRRRRC